MKNTITTMMAAAIILSAATAPAATPLDVKCRAAKNKIAGAYYACREKAEATAVAKSLPSADYSKCTAKFNDKWAKAEEDGGAMCPDEMPLAPDMAARIDAQTNEASQLIAGTWVDPPTPTCGDADVNDAGEQCDGADLDGLTCADFGLYGTLACTGGCNLDLSGCTSCPSPGVTYGNACWTYGARGASCTTACAALGMTYDDDTAIIAGSSGSDTNCVAVLDAVGANGDVLDNPGGDCAGLGLGCSVLPDTGYRARCGTPTTTAGALFADARRACACE